MKKRIAYLLAAAVVIVLCLPAAVFANAAAVPVSAVFDGETAYDLEEGETDLGIRRGGGVNKFTITFSDGSKKEYICVSDDEDFILPMEYYEDGDMSKDYLQVDTVIEGGKLKAGENTVYFRCYVPGFETSVDSEPITVTAYPLVVDVKLIQSPKSEPLWSYEGSERAWGNGGCEIGDQLQLLYRDGSTRTFEYVRYKYWDATYDHWAWSAGYFENGEVKFDRRGYPLPLDFKWKTASGTGLKYGTDQLKICVYSGEDYVASSESYDVIVYFNVDDIEFSIPGPLRVKVLNDGYMFTYIPEEAVVTCTNENGDTYYFRPAKVKGKYGDEVGFTLNGEDYGDSIDMSIWEFKEFGLKKGLNRGVSVEIGYHYLFNDDDLDIIAEGDAFQPMTVNPKTCKVRYAKLKKATQKLAVSKVLTVKKAAGAVTYTKRSGNKKITIAYKTGKVTVQKGLKKGTYKVKVLVQAAGNDRFIAGYKMVTFKIKVS